MAVSARLAARVVAGELLASPAQTRAAVALDGALARAASAQRWFWWAPGAVSGRRGVYLSGSVGSGKSMLVDSLHDAAADAGVPTTRVHWHAWIASVHAALHDRRGSGDAMGDKLKNIGAAAAEGTRLLCFDELAVHDVADALILRTIFAELLARGVMVCATSNRAPRDLYARGLNRGLFLPFVDLLEASVEHVPLDVRADFRRSRIPVGDAASLYVVDATRLPSAVARLAGAPVAFANAPLPVAHGRSVDGEVAVAGPRLARAAFPSLCGAPLGASDYHALADAFGGLVLTAVPVLDADRHDEVRRFIALVDVFYDRGRALVLEAAAPIDALLAGDGGAEWTAADASLGSIAGVKDTQFAWDRTTSRLVEMTASPAYRDRWRRRFAA